MPGKIKLNQSHFGIKSNVYFPYTIHHSLENEIHFDKGCTM